VEPVEQTCPPVKFLVLVQSKVDVHLNKGGILADGIPLSKQEEATIKRCLHNGLILANHL
jgi:hypothetical protein